MKTVKERSFSPVSVVLFAFLLFTFLTSVHAQDTEEDTQQKKWGADVKAVGQLGTDRSIGELDFFLPVWQSKRTLVFGDLRGKFDDESSREGNYGGGVRYMMENGWNVGGYGFFDLRTSPKDNQYKQATVGVEAMSANWDARVNGYLPFGDTEYSEPEEAEVTLSGGNIQMKAGQEKAMAGADAEIGYRLPITDADSGLNARVYGGGYYFEADGVEDVAGPRVRGEVRWNDPLNSIPGSRLTLTAKWQDDDPRGSQGFVGARVSIPLPPGDGSRSKLSMQERRMTEYVQRDVDIVTQAGAFGDEENVRNVRTGTRITGEVVTVDEDLERRDVSQAGEKGLIIVRPGDDGTVSGGVSLKDGQTLLGGDHELIVEGVESGQTTTLNVPGDTPTLIGDTTSDDFVLEVGSDTYVGGVDVGPGNSTDHGIQARDGVDQVHIVDTRVQNMNGIGMFFSGSSGRVRIDQSVVEQTDDQGLHFNGPTHDVRVTRSTIQGTNDRSNVEFDGPARNVRIVDSTIRNADTTRNLFFDNGVDGLEIVDSTIESSGGVNVEIQDTGKNMRLTDSTIQGAKEENVLVDGAASEVRITGNTIRAAEDEAIEFVEGASDVLIANNTISGIDDQGILFGEDTDSVENVRIQQNVIEGLEEQAIKIDSTDSRDVLIAGNEVRGTEGQGIFLAGGGAADVNILNNVISEVGDKAIHVESSSAHPASRVLIANNTMRNVFDREGIDVGSFSSKIKIRNNTFENLENDAIDIDSDASDAVIANNTIKNVFHLGGIEVGDHSTGLTVRNNTIRNTENEGIEVGSNASNLLVAENTIDVVSNDSGIRIDSGARGVNVLNNTIRNTAQASIRVNGGTEVRIASNTLQNSSAGHGLKVSGPMNDVELVRNVVRNVHQTGIKINNDADGILIKENVIRNAGGDGIDLGFFDEFRETVVKGNVINTVGRGNEWLDVNTDTSSSSVEVTGNRFRGTGGSTVVELGEQGTDAGMFTGEVNINETPFRPSQKRFKEVGTVNAGSPGFEIFTPAESSTITIGDH